MIFSLLNATYPKNPTKMYMAVHMLTATRITAFSLSKAALGTVSNISKSCLKLMVRNLIDYDTRINLMRVEIHTIN